MLPIFIERQHLNRDMPRPRILFQVVKHRPPQHVRQKDIKGNGRGMKFLGESQRLRTSCGHQDFKSFFASQVTQHGRKIGVIFDDQESRIVRLQIFTIIFHGNLFDGAL